MTENQRKKIDDLFYTSNLEETKQIKKIEAEKKIDREKRIKQKNKKQKDNEKFDKETEIVIGMTNRKKQKEVQQSSIKNKNKDITKKQKKINRKKKISKLMIKFIILVILIIAGVIFALVSPIFNITNIEIKNNNQLSSETIVSLSQLQKGQNIYKFNKKEVEKQIKTNAYIENIEINRIIPNKVLITVYEREKNFNVEFLNGYAYINNQGYILEISEQKLELPIIQGITTPQEEIIAGNRLNNEDLERLEVAIQIIDICKNYELDKKVTSINISDKNNYSIYIQEELKTIYLGDKTNLNNKMLYVPPILEENKGKEGNIYINGDLNNNFKPRFREKV